MYSRCTVVFIQRNNKFRDFRLFQIVVRCGGGENPKFYCGRTFLLGEENLRRSDFDNLNPFQS